MTIVPPRNLDAALRYVRGGATLYVRTATRNVRIRQRDLDKWTAAGLPLLREDGNGYRMQTGAKTSVYLLPGTLWISNA